MGSTETPGTPPAPEEKQRGSDFSWPPSGEELATWEVVEFRAASEAAPPAEDAPAEPLAAPAEAAADAAASSRPPVDPRTVTGRGAEGLVLRDTASAPAAAMPHGLSVPPRVGIQLERPALAAFVASRARRAARPALATVLVAATAAAGFFAGLRYAAGRLPIPTTAAIHVDSEPAGALVYVDGVERGQTPVDFTVAPGERRLEVVAGTARRTVEFTAAAGGSASHHFEFAGAAAAATEVGAADAGTLVVRSEPSGASVVIGGKLLGVTPLTVTGLATGVHEVLLTGASGPVTQRIQVQAGGTATLVVPMTGRTASGWLAARAPIELTIIENGSVINTTRSDQTMLPAGRHELEFVSEEFEFRATQTVVIPAGRRLTLDVPVPSGRANFNARPWAEVWLGEQRLGETPLGNVPLPIGRHEIVFRHPQFGERRQTLVVKATTTARAVVDFTP